MNLRLRTRVENVEKQADETAREARDAKLRSLTDDQLLELNRIVTDAGDDVTRIDYSQMSDGLRSVLMEA